MARKAAKALPRNLRLKGQTFWFSRDVPADCQAVFGKKTWMVNLETSDLKASVVRRNELEVDTKRAFGQMRAGTWKPKVGLSPSENEGLSPSESGEVYRQLITSLSKVRAESLETLPDDDREISPRKLGILLTPEERDSDEEAIALEMMVSAAEAARDNLRGTQRRAFEQTLRGDVDVAHHVDAYAVTISALAKETVAGRKGNIRQFARWAAEKGVRIDAVDRRRAGQYVTEVIDPMDPKTAKTHISSLRFYWTFLHKRGHISGGDAKGGPWADQLIVANGTQVKRGDKDETVRHDTEGEVRALLYSPFPPRMTAAFESQIRDAIRMALLSGMRLEEIATLLAGEARDGVFDIQQGKSAAAVRRVPIHPDLLELVERRTAGKKPQDWLFHELAKASNPGDLLGKRFRAYRLAVGVDDTKEGKRPSLVNFHSARHWFARTASFGGQSDTIIGSVIGHRPDTKNTTRRVYIQDTSDAQMRACVEAVHLPPEVTL